MEGCACKKFKRTAATRAPATPPPIAPEPPPRHEPPKEPPGAAVVRALGLDEVFGNIGLFGIASYWLWSMWREDRERDKAERRGDRALRRAGLDRIDEALVAEAHRWVKSADLVAFGELRQASSPRERVRNLLQRGLLVGRGEIVDGLPLEVGASSWGLLSEQLLRPHAPMPNDPTPPPKPLVLPEVPPPLPLTMTLSLSPSEVTMATRHELMLHISVRNDGTSPIDFDMSTTRFLFMGRPAAGWRQVVAGTPARALAPGEEAQFVFPVPATFVRTPGRYAIQLVTGSTRSSRLEMVVN